MLRVGGAVGGKSPAGPAGDRATARDRYLTLLKAGGSDHPMELLRRAGVDLGQPETVRAVVDQLDGLVARLEKELGPSPA